MKREKFKVRLCLDSGAFSAWTQGEKIDVHDYIAYVKKNKHLLDTYFNLDVIPGKPNQPRTPEQVKKAAKQSYRNLQIMKKAGLDPIPVFHQGESFEWLNKLLEDNHVYIALGGLGGQSDTESIIWLDRCFNILTDKQGRAIIKIHGLGVSSFNLLRRYPWYSCDSTSWAKSSAFGSIFIPGYKGGNPDYSLNPTKITVSRVERGSGVPADHYDLLGEMTKTRVKDYLNNHVGVTVNQVREDYVLRAKTTVYFMKRFVAEIGDVRFRQKGSSFTFE